MAKSSSKEPGGLDFLTAARAALERDGFIAYCRGRVIELMWNLGGDGDLKEARGLVDAMLNVAESSKPTMEFADVAEGPFAAMKRRCDVAAPKSAVTFGESAARHAKEGER